MVSMRSCLLVILLGLMGCNQASSENWDGEYAYSVVLGGPQGAPTASRDYVLMLGKSCSLSADGFQTHYVIRCQQRTEGNGIAISFIEYDKSDPVPATGAPQYKSYDVLFRLSMDKDKSIVTEWRALKPKEGIKSTGKYFEKETDE